MDVLAGENADKTAPMNYVHRIAKNNILIKDIAFYSYINNHSCSINHFLYLLIQNIFKEISVILLY
jgi:hypothetical protein